MGARGAVVGGDMREQRGGRTDHRPGLQPRVQLREIGTTIGVLVPAFDHQTEESDR